MTQEEKPVMRILEQNKMLVIPEQFYAGGMYRVAGETQVVGWERIYEISASEIKQQET
jgi:hypothetical protein